MFIVELAKTNSNNIIWRSILLVNEDAQYPRMQKATDLSPAPIIFKDFF